MKTIKITLMLALIVSANIALATGNLKVNILPLTAERAVVAISNSDKSEFGISVESKYGEVLYSNQTNGSSKEYNRIFDFSQLQSGDYNLVVNIDGAISKRAFSIDGYKITVGELKKAVEPFFSYEENVLRVAFLNYANDNLKLTIYDGGTSIYEKALENTFSVNEGLDLSKLNKGDYSVVLSAGVESYRYTVDVQ